MPSNTNNSINFDKIWKILTLLLSVIILPLFAWVWDTNTSLAELNNDLGDTEKVITNLETKIKEADDNTKSIISIEKDIEYMKGSLERIERIIANG